MSMPRPRLLPENGRMEQPEDADDIHEIARTMIKHYGSDAPSLMETRACNCRRHGEPASAAFWLRVAAEAKKLQASEPWARSEPSR